MYGRDKTKSIIENDNNLVPKVIITHLVHTICYYTNKYTSVRLIPV